MPFITKLEVTHGKGTSWTLSSALAYASSETCVIKVPKGFITDFASIPRVMLSVIGRPTGRLTEPSVLHDFLYSGVWHRAISRSGADGVFLKAMKENGVGRIKRYTVWLGVRAGGWVRYKGGKDV